MRILVVGAGSIGTRHAANLLELGHEVHCTDTNPDCLAKLPDGIVRHPHLDAALACRPDAAFICTFSNAHIDVAYRCASAGCHLFIEKPLSVTLDGVNRLSGLLGEKQLISMVGCNMRFHPAIAFIASLTADSRELGKVLWADLEFGYFLPFAKQNYESCYMAKRSMGGNLILDDIHEIDCAIWLLGRPNRVFCSRGILSRLKIDTEDFVDMSLRFDGGAVCRIHMDYLQHGYSRRYKIVCEHGTINWDFQSGTVRWMTEKGRKWDEKAVATEISYNRMYLDEAGYFVECVRTGTATMNPVGAAAETLKTALAAQRSCVTEQWELIT